MRKTWFFSGISVVCLALAACSEDPGSYNAEAAGEAPASVDSVATESAATDGEAAASEVQMRSPSSEVPILPRMAFVYDYGFRLPGSEINALQMRHADMCEALGPSQCMIVGMTSTGNLEEEDASGQLELAVASPIARGFAGELAMLAEAFHGEQVSASITGEDLSKQMVDTEAHLRSRTELRDRLLEVLRTRRGSVEDLVQAEQNVAEINREIDQARSWMAEMRGRVAFSRVVLNYASATPVGSDFLSPVRGALGSLGSILGVLVAVLIVLGGIAAPFLLGALGLRQWQKRKALASEAG